MTSSKFTHKINSPNKPKICKVPPLIPAAKPPVPWPPETFAFHCQISGTYYGTPVSAEHTWDLTRDGETWYWTGNATNAGVTYTIVAFYVGPETHELSLEIDTENPDEMWDSHAVISGVPVNWETPSIYVIEDWDEEGPDQVQTKVDFTF